MPLLYAHKQIHHPRLDLLCQRSCIIPGLHSLLSVTMETHIFIHVRCNHLLEPFTTLLNQRQKQRLVLGVQLENNDVHDYILYTVV